MKKTALVTGATSGFGKAIALRLIRLGYKVIATGRRAERLAEMQQQITAEGGEILTLCFDVRNLDECKNALENIPTEWQHIDLLINNAGLAAGASPFNDSLTDDFDRMIDTNVKGLLYVSKIIVPKMIALGGGQIVNISSIAGIEVYPGGSVYCASKHAVNAVTKGMRLDLVDKNIRVSSISPGMAETEFSLVRYNGDREKAAAVYKGIDALSADDIADALEFIVTRPQHVNIQDILITPAQQANTYISYRTKN